MSLLAAPSARPLLAATCYRVLPILTVMGNRITSFTALAQVKQRSGISPTTFSSAARLAQLFRLAGPWSHPERPAFHRLRPLYVRFLPILLDSAQRMF